MGNPRKCLAYTGKPKNKIDDLGVPPFQEPSHTHIYIYVNTFILNWYL